MRPHLILCYTIGAQSRERERESGRAGDGAVTRSPARPTFSLLGPASFPGVAPSACFARLVAIHQVAHPKARRYKRHERRARVIAISTGPRSLHNCAVNQTLARERRRETEKKQNGRTLEDRVRTENFQTRASGSGGHTRPDPLQLCVATTTAATTTRPIISKSVWMGTRFFSLLERLPRSAQLDSSRRSRGTGAA